MHFPLAVIVVGNLPFLTIATGLFVSVLLVFARLPGFWCRTLFALYRPANTFHERPRVSSVDGSVSLHLRLPIYLGRSVYRRDIDCGNAKFDDLLHVRRVRSQLLFLDWSAWKPRSVAFL